jgi:hypothetical protein
MANVSLTNILTQGSFETTTTNNWITGRGANAATRLTPIPTAHSEFGVACGQLNQQINYSSGGSTNKCSFHYSPFNVIAGRIYYMRALYRCDTNNETAFFSTTNWANGIGAAPTSFFGMAWGPTGIGNWNFIDLRWTAPSNASIPFSIQMNNLGMNGNNPVIAQIDNVMFIDLTEAFGAGNELSIGGIREIIENNTQSGGRGYFDGTITINIQDPPIIETIDVAPGLLGRYYSTQIDLQVGTGTEPLSWSITGLPAGNGQSISGSGLIFGQLGLSEGAYSFTVQVIDALGRTATKQYTLNVGEPPVLLDNVIPNPVTDIPYS